MSEARNSYDSTTSVTSLPRRISPAAGQTSTTGKRKINIKPLTDERVRQVTFSKRKFGLMKKCYELSVLCNCDIGLMIFSQRGKLFQYASNDMESLLVRYMQNPKPLEYKTSADLSYNQATSSDQQEGPRQLPQQFLNMYAAQQQQNPAFDQSIMMIPTSMQESGGSTSSGSNNMNGGQMYPMTVATSPMQIISPQQRMMSPQQQQFQLQQQLQQQGQYYFQPQFYQVPMQISPQNNQQQPQ